MPPTTPGVDERPTDVTPGTGTATTGTGLPMVTTDKPGKSVLPFFFVVFSFSEQARLWDKLCDDLFFCVSSEKAKCVEFDFSSL